MKSFSATFRLLALPLFLLGLPGFAQTVPLEGILKGVETRYNSVATLQMDFVQVYTAANRAKRVESGKLQLRKPGRMRWEYFKPDGKLFISDGKEYWFYSPMARRAEKMKLKEAQDWQAPLGMLIGKLDFQRDFSKYLIQPAANGLQRITCEPRNPSKSPFRQIAFIAGQDFRVQELTVTGQDGSVMEFRFSNEVRNPAQEASLYKFVPPAGTEVIEGGGGGQ